MALTNQTAIENYMLIDIDASFASQLNSWIDAVTKYIEGVTNRRIIADATDTEYLYDGTNKHSMMVDDFVSITSIEIIDDRDTDARTDITDDCYYYPANETPKWKIEYTSLFPRGRQNIAITGKRGFTTQAGLPADLELAATIFVAGIINYSNSHSGEVKSESIGRYSVTYTTDAEKEDYAMAMETLKGYRRIR